MAVTGVGYSIPTLAALTALDVTTLIDKYLRYVVSEDTWYRYDAAASSGGIPPDVGSGRWFRQNGTGISEIKVSSFTAIPFGAYGLDSASALTVTFPATPSVGTPVEITNYNTGAISIDPNGGKINGTTGIQRLVDGRICKFIYSGATKGWLCFNDDLVRTLYTNLKSFYEFNTSVYVLGDYVGGKDLVDTGTIPLTYTTGLVAGSDAANFDSATAGYKLEQADTQYNIGASDIKTFTFLININSSTELILSKKETATSNYCYKIYALDSTTIRFSVTTTGGTFNADATVTSAYSTLLSIRAEINKAANTITLQVDDAGAQGTPITISISGTFNAADPLVIGQTTAGNQIVAVIDQIRFYSGASLDTVQKNLLWNSGAFI